MVVANLGGRVYVSPQVRDPALATTTPLTPLRTIKKFPEETFQGAHVSLKKENSNFTTPELVKIAESAPCDYFDHVAKAAQPDDLLDFYILPVLGYSLRTFLDGFAEQASRAITKYDDVTVRDRPLRCPVCGGTPDFAAVYATARNGNVKHLYCGVCGANWKFERIRCAACGSSVVSDLSYVHEEKDPSRRLHVCKACGEAVPTFFAPGGEESFSPEIERILVTGLEAAYAEERVN